MPLSGNLTPAPRAPQNDPGAATKYMPARQAAGGMNGNTAPIPGQPAPGEERAPPPAGGAPGEQREETPEAAPDASRFALLAEQDRKLRALQRDVRDGESRLKKMQDDLEVRQQQLRADEEREGRRRKDPKFLLQEYGYSPEGALQYMLNGEKLTPEQALAANLDDKLRQQAQTYEERIEELNKQLEEREQLKEQEGKRQQEALQKQQETVLVQELEADIGDVVATDPQGFALLTESKERGLRAVYMHLEDLSNKMYADTGRRPPVTSKLIERAAREVEEAAREEMRTSLTNPAVAQALGVGRPVPQRPKTLTNRMPPASPGTGRQEAIPENESPRQKQERVKGLVAELLMRGRAVPGREG